VPAALLLMPSCSASKLASSDLHGTGNSVGRGRAGSASLSSRGFTRRYRNPPHRINRRCDTRRLERVHPQNAEHEVVRNYVRTSTFFLSSRVLPDPRRRFLLPPARMVHRVTMGSLTRRFGRLPTVTVTPFLIWYDLQEISKVSLWTVTEKGRNFQCFRK
jgi:hypothetical protein